MTKLAAGSPRYCHSWPSLRIDFDGANRDPFTQEEDSVVAHCKAIGSPFSPHC